MAASAPDPTAPDPTAPDPTAPDPTAPDPAATDPLATDPEIAALLESEATRRRGSLQMLAAESSATPAVRAAVGSIRS